MRYTLKMASHYKWYPSSEEVVVPWNARYSFPSQANKAIKITPRIPPKSGSTFAPGQIIRLEFPAQGYVNPTNTTLEFDVALLGPVFTAAVEYGVRFQNNIQSLFQRVRLLYGATPLEDILNYNVIVRCLTEWTGTNQYHTIDQNSIANGVGGMMLAYDSGGFQGLCNVRQKYIQGIQDITPGPAANLTGGAGSGAVPNTANTIAGVTPVANQVVTTRRYQVSFALGLFTQDKLIPVKFMASQLAIEITLAQPQECIFYRIQTSPATETTSPTYFVGNINLIPEILEFDSSYDAMFLRGLREGGVPIKFSSWHSFFFSSASSSSFNMLVQERSRSVKSLFAVQRLPQSNFSFDNGATFFATSGITVAGVPAVVQTGTLQSYQFRIGGRYFPAAPVQTALTLGSTISNGGAEAYLELQKALNIVGDQRLSVSTNCLKWAVPTDFGGVVPAFDFDAQFGAFNGFGVPITGITVTTLNAFVGNYPSCAFACAIDLETSNGMEISGLNAEEQSDIAFLAQYSSPQISGSLNTASSVEIYSYYDAMIVLRENNVLELIQ